MRIQRERQLAEVSYPKIESTIRPLQVCATVQLGTDHSPNTMPKTVLLDRPQKTTEDYLLFLGICM